MELGVEVCMTECDEDVMEMMALITEREGSARRQGKDFLSDS